MASKNKMAATISKPMASEGLSSTTFTHGPLSTGAPAQVSPDELKEHILTHNMCFKNYAYPDAEKLFPYEQHLWACDRYYPLTKLGAPVYVDEPMYEDDEKICDKKAAFLREKGVKYLIIKKTTDLSSAMEQLGVA